MKIIIIKAFSKQNLESDFSGAHPWLILIHCLGPLSSGTEPVEIVTYVTISTIPVH